MKEKLLISLIKHIFFYLEKLNQKDILIGLFL